MISHPTNPDPADQGSATARWSPAARLAFYAPVVEQPTLADRKASFLLTMTGLVSTTLFFFLDVLARIMSGPDRARGVSLAVLVCVLIGLLMASAYNAFSGYVSSLPQHATLAFYRHLAARDLEAYTREMESASHEQAVDAILHYHHAAARQAVAKYLYVNRALACMRWAIPLWMLVLLLLALWR